MLAETMKEEIRSEITKAIEDSRVDEDAANNKASDSMIINMEKGFEVEVDVHEPSAIHGPRFKMGGGPASSTPAVTDTPPSRNGRQVGRNGRGKRGRTARKRN